ncbi:MAG: flagellar hook-basal body protein [Clostridia bacterium]|jgi:flagellar basal-body rod protein FlgG|nr:flagellar hook-basal body protein [Clostridia bacterium]
MNMSFYTAAAGASAQQSKLDVVANNIANINTRGYKSKTSSFSDLVYSNLSGAQGQNASLKIGSGAKIEKTGTVFSHGSIDNTDSKFDLSIDGRGFFALQNPETKEVVYTTNGNFIMSRRGNKFYLASKDGYLVLGKNGKPMEITGQENKLEPAVYDFPVEDGFISAGDTNFIPTAKNGKPFLTDTNVRQNSLECSNVDFSKEISKVVEAERAYQYSLKMVETSDEIQNLINTLRS